MSKGEIVRHIAEGKYRVRQKLAAERIRQEVAQLEERIAELAVQLPTAKLERLQANDAVESKVREIDLAIPDLQAGVEGSRKRITALQTDMIQLQATARVAQLRVSDLIAENLSVLKRRSQLEAVPEGRELEAWCADYTMDLSGEVGLVDINDEGGKGVIIQPGYSDGSAYNAERDGSLFPDVGQSPKQLFFNAALLPGVQKWSPRYRVGEITQIQADVCTVLLDSVTSSAQGLPINQVGILHEVPIVYMDCDGAAFQEGDRVLVRFTVNGPLVVGFEKEPVPCSMFGFVFEPARYISGSAPTFKALKQTYGEPFEDVTGLINPPLGSIDGGNSAWTAIPSQGDLNIEQANPRNYGNKNWFNSDKVVLSWHGPPGRAHRMDQLDIGLSGFQADWETEPYVFHGLDIILDLSEESVTGAFNNVFGASIYSDSQSQRWLVVVASDQRYFTEQSFKVFRVPVDASLQPTGGLEFLHQVTLAQGMAYQSHFYFSGDGTKAVCTIIGDLSDSANLHIDLLRYDINMGFSVEQIWSRADPIGTVSTVETYSQQSGVPVAGYITTTASLYRSFQPSAHQVPIYCDYVGDQEVIAYESRPAIDSVRNSQYNYLSGGGQIEWTASGNLEEMHAGYFSVVTSTGRTLFTMPYNPDKSESLSYSALQVEAGGYLQISNIESARHGGIDWEENLLAIDVRFDFCAVVHGGYQYTRDDTVDTDWNDLDLNDSSAQADGTITGNEIVETVEIWQNGSPLKTIEARRMEGPVQVGAYSTDPLPALQLTGSNIDIEAPIYPPEPLKIGSKHLLTAAAYYSGRHSIASFGMNYVTGSEQRESVLFSQVSGYVDAVSGIIDRSGSDGFLLCSVGLI